MSTLRGHLGDIDHGIKRVASITQSLRAFVAYNDDDAAVPVDLQAVIARSIKMVANDIRHVAKLVHETTQIPFVIGSAPRLEQVFVNLLINALKALPGNSTTPHEIHVSVTHAGDRVTVAIRDTGCGIPAALRGRIFDPFFTTRDVGHGMGLGLSVSKTIVEKYGGHLEVESVENAGTTVSVHLRVHATKASSTQAAPAVKAPLPRLRILVVDDEPMICEVLARILGSEHEVTIARTGEDALTRLSTTTFNVILCDIMMPGMNGIDVYQQLAAQQPGIEQRIVFMSGGTMGTGITNALAALPNGHLAKPFNIERVLEVVRAYHVP
jgi:CheY-like chemotaxis protein/two-component sensor histidine kinase